VSRTNDFLRVSMNFRTSLKKGTKPYTFLLLISPLNSFDTKYPVKLSTFFWMPGSVTTIKRFKNYLLRPLVWFPWFPQRWGQRWLQFHSWWNLFICLRWFLVKRTLDGQWCRLGWTESFTLTLDLSAKESLVADWSASQRWLVGQL
jgi:hypothetical protein